MKAKDNDVDYVRTNYPALRHIQTRWNDNDHYGHLNNAVYFELFDTAVNGYLIDATGIDIRELDARGFVVDVSCKYRRPVTFPNDLAIGLRVTRLGGRSVSYGLGLFAGDDDEPSAVGTFVHVYVDRHTGQSTNVPPEIRDAVAPLEDPTEPSS